MFQRQSGYDLAHILDGLGALRLLRGFAEVSLVRIADGGQRRVILVTNNENNICTEVCYPRVRKVIEGYVNHKGEQIKGLGGSLKYFRTAFKSKA